jgi:hypothetical protein
LHFRSATLWKRSWERSGDMQWLNMPLFQINSKLIFFVHVPKTGGSAISNVLSRFGRAALITHNDHVWPRCNAQHMEAASYLRILPGNFYDYGFMVVRNPFDRIVSEYRMRARDQASRGRRIKEFPEWVESVLRRYRRNNYIFDNHFRPQTEFLSDGIEVFKLESGLVEVVERLSEITGMVFGSELPRVQVSKSIGFKVSAECAAAVAKFYYADFRAFGYDDNIEYLIKKEGAELVSKSSKYPRLLKYYAMKLSG